MRHNGKKARKVIAQHFERKCDGLSTKYIPITEDAHKHWRTTGICTKCCAQALSGSRCKRCGEEHK